MFDTIAGLPLHPLIIHVVVVIGPLTALLAIAYAVRPIWRRPLRWPLVAGAVVTAISALVATESGEALLVRVATKGTAITTAFTEHQAAGEMARNSAAALLLLVLMATLSVLIPAPPARSGEGRRWSTDRTAEPAPGSADQAGRCAGRVRRNPARRIPS